MGNSKFRKIKMFIKFSIAVLSVLVGVQAAPANEMTAEEFRASIFSAEGTYMSDKPTFGKFYAPWCGHCKRIAPIWDELAEAKGDDINIVSIDCTNDVNREMCKKFEVKGYPTLLFFPNEEELKGTYVSYKGKRDLYGFNAYINDSGYI